MNMESIPLMFYTEWFNKKVKNNLTDKQKKDLLMKISNISLRKPIHIAGVEFEKKEFPELAPFMNTEKLSGLQLYAVMTELFNELQSTWLKNRRQ